MREEGEKTYPLVFLRARFVLALNLWATRGRGRRFRPLGVIAAHDDAKWQGRRVEEERMEARRRTVVEGRGYVGADSSGRQKTPV